MMYDQSWGCWTVQQQPYMQYLVFSIDTYTKNAFNAENNLLCCQLISP